MQWFGRRCDDLLRLDPTAAGADGARRPAGATGPIPVNRIIGTVSRCCDFDQCFRVLRRHLDERLRAARARWPVGQALPPIRVHRAGSDYYVVDGHHRVALARERGMVAIDAHVT